MYFQPFLKNIYIFAFFPFSRIHLHSFLIPSGLDTRFDWSATESETTEITLINS